MLGCVCFVCELARERACVRACELVFVEFGDGQPAAATAETACRSSESPMDANRVTRWIGIHGFTPSSLPPLPYLPCVCSAGDRDRQPAADVSACRTSLDELAICAHDPGRLHRDSRVGLSRCSTGPRPATVTIAAESESPSRADPRRISLLPGPASLSHAAGRGADSAESGSVAWFSFRISGRSGSRPGGRGQRPAQSCP